MNLFEITPLTRPLSELPEPDTIHYVAARNGLFLRKPTALGPVMVPMKTMPEHLAEVDKEKTGGHFVFTADSLPPELMAQVVAWFRRVFETHGTEAEVLLTYNETGTPKYRTFIPTQKNSSVSVTSIHDPSHIRKGWQLVGSIHSHCDFSAFHSGTDTHDASTFNGLHITIGKVNTDTPEYAAMVMMNGVRFDYEVDQIADLSLVGTGSAPEWWDRYLTKTEPPLKNVPKSDVVAWTSGVTRNVGTPTRHWSDWRWSQEFYYGEGWDGGWGGSEDAYDAGWRKYRDAAPEIVARKPDTPDPMTALSASRTSAEAVDAATDALYEIAAHLEHKGLYLSWILANEDGEEMDGSTMDLIGRDR